MRRWSFAKQRLRVKDTLIAVVVFFVCFSFIQVLLTPGPNDAAREHELFQQRLLLIAKERGEDFLADKLIFRREQLEETFERQMSAEEGPARIVLQGIQSLPSPFDASQPADDARPASYEFLKLPRRISGTYGLVKLRELQGHTFGGSFMKGALVIVVPSALPSLARRNLIRRTWASVRDIEGWKIETVFIVGSRKDGGGGDLDAEVDMYGDVIQYDGADGPSAATDKLLAGMQWAHDTLPRDFIYASAPDDAVVNVELVRDYLDQRVTPVKPPARLFSIAQADGTTLVSGQLQTLHCFGSFASDEQVERRLDRPRAVSVPLYQADRWPPYCGESLFAMPVQMAGDIGRVLRALPSAHLPPGLGDVLVTGIGRRLLERGDPNIAAATGAELGAEPVKRFPVEAGTRPHQQGFEKGEGEKAVKTWRALYGRLKSRYHIYTYYD